jgi:hypothetical protein
MVASESCSGGRRWGLLVPTEAYNPLAAKVGNLLCHLFHRSISRPVNGRYRCWKCLREFELRW